MASYVMQSGTDFSCILDAIQVMYQVNSALHPRGVAESSTSFGWGKDGQVTAAMWQVTLCDPICHVISRSSEVISTNC